MFKSLYQNKSSPNLQCIFKRQDKNKIVTQNKTEHSTLITNNDTLFSIAAMNVWVDAGQGQGLSEVMLDQEDAALLTKWNQNIFPPDGWLFI